MRYPLTSSLREFQYQFWKGVGLFWLMEKLGIRPKKWIVYRQKKVKLTTK